MSFEPGARFEGGVTRFAVYAPTARTCEVRLYDQDGAPTLAPRALSPLGAGRYALEVDDAPPGTLYDFVLDGRALPDPFARALPRGVHGPALVTRDDYAWRHGRGPRRPLAQQVIYELHVGTFTPEGTFLAALGRLPALVDLGVTTLELLPLAAFAGERGWGYDGVALFAPHPAYGTPDELRALLDGAHGLGLAVLLDVVFNHLGPAGNYLGAYSGEYFTREVSNPWGDAPDFARGPMRALVLASAQHWIGSYRFDGLRLDATHAMVDPSGRHILDELVATLRALDPGLTLIAEDERNEAALVRATGLDAVWADDFHHALRVTLTGERDGYFGDYAPGAATVAEAIRGGWYYQGQAKPDGRPRGTGADELAASAFVYCIQNHDQVGNRALGERLHHVVSLDAYCMASAVLLFLPMTPLLFMGQEWAASTPFLFFTDHERELGRRVSAGRREEFKRFAVFADPAARALIPDPQDPLTFARSRLRWEERSAPDHARVLDLYRALLSLRRIDPVLRDAGRDALRADAVGDVLRVRRALGDEARLLLANCSAQPVDVAALLDGATAPLLSSGVALDGTTLPAWTAVIAIAR